LLLTVVFSQVLSGVSCCCLARSIAIGNHSQPQVSDQATAPRCSKCAAHVSSELAASDSHHQSSRPSDRSRNGDAQSSTNTCSCVKAPLVASPSDDQVSLKQTVSGWITPAYISKFSTSVSRSPFHRFEPLAQFSGGSWQSIACIWRN
jgi:hypothetical protein